jgi:hypothetical protein
MRNEETVIVLVGPDSCQHYPKRPGQLGSDIRVAHPMALLGLTSEDHSGWSSYALVFARTFPFAAQPRLYRQPPRDEQHSTDHQNSEDEGAHTDSPEPIKPIVTPANTESINAA